MARWMVPGSSMTLSTGFLIKSNSEFPMVLNPFFRSEKLDFKLDKLLFIEITNALFIALLSFVISE